MRSSSAYPKLSGWQFIKYGGVVTVGMFLMIALFTDGPSPADAPPAGVETSTLRGSSPLSGSAKLSDLIAVGLGLTEKAEKVIKDVKYEHKEDLKVKGLTKEGVEEPVTVADTNSNLVFVNGYRNHFEGVTILSEETEPEKDSIRVDNPVLPSGLQLPIDPELNLSDTLIIIDPLDATKEFGENLLEYVTTMVCIVYKGVPIAGIINQVFEDSKPPVVGVVALESGQKGVLFNRVNKEPKGHLVAMSRSHTGEGSNVVEKYLEGHAPKLAGGAGFKSLLVLDGEAEAYIHVTAIKSWDVCAAEAVMKASGGDFGDIEGRRLEYPMEYDRKDATHSRA